MNLDNIANKEFKGIKHFNRLVEQHETYVPYGSPVKVVTVELSHPSGDVEYRTYRKEGHCYVRH
jgi:hypothetical protein